MKARRHRPCALPCCDEPRITHAERDNTLSWTSRGESPRTAPPLMRIVGAPVRTD